MTCSCLKEKGPLKLGRLSMKLRYYVIFMSTDDRTVTKKIINQMKEYNTYGRHLAFDCPTSISSSFNIAP